MNLLIRGVLSFALVRPYPYIYVLSFVCLYHIICTHPCRRGLRVYLCPVSAVTLVTSCSVPLSLPGIARRLRPLHDLGGWNIQRWLVEIYTVQIYDCKRNNRSINKIYIKPSPHVEASTEISCANPMVSPWAWWNHRTSVLVTREDSVLDTSRKLA